MTSCDYSTNILLLDMIKAFDTINIEHLYGLFSPERRDTASKKIIKQKEEFLQ